MQLQSAQDFDAFIQAGPLAAVYFSAPDCAVCGVMEPKLRGLLAARFPAVAWAEVDARAQPELAAQQGVFTVPTLLIYLDGREGLRKSRSFSLVEVAEALERPYAMLADEIGGPG